jgi:hypothetical protein
MNRTAAFAARHALRWAMMMALLLAAIATERAWPSEAQDAEYRIKAAFLCKFGNYVEWPAASASGAQVPFEVGVLATPAVVDELMVAARGQTVNGRPIVVRRLERGDPLDGLNMVFVARSHAARLGEVLAALKDRPVLTVTESDPGTAAGSMVNFIVVDDKVKFDISLTAAERSKLRISARLLGVARNVIGRPL